MDYNNKPDFAKLPKVELHLHLDGSLSYGVVKQLRPSTTLEEYSHSFIAPPKCTYLADYIKRAIKGFELMLTSEQLRLLTLDLFKQLKADNVLHAEIRYAPLQHTTGRMSAEYIPLAEVFDWRITQFKKCNSEAIMHPFAAPTIKENIRKQIELAYENEPK